tara:strand:+ start:90 stop:491 length:402 start_codon:yes stop_codon:yes gene_type:complete
MKKHSVFILTIFISIVYSKFCYVYSSEIILSENSQKGLEIAQEHCSRCHIVSEKNRYSSIETTPSFFGLRKMSDWQERFSEFFVRPPHPALVNIIDVTEERSKMLPAFVQEIDLTLEQIDYLISYVKDLKKKN